MKQEIRRNLKKAIMAWKKEKILPDFTVPDIVVDYSKEEKFGDYSTNIAMVLAGVLKKKPMEVAEEVIKRLDLSQPKRPKEVEPRSVFEKIGAVAPGYINFYLSEKYLQEKVAEINRKAQKFGNSNIGKKKKVLVEFISANPTGPVTLGNGRGGPLGDALASILEKSGYKASREFYINDFGNQVVILGHSILKDEEAQYKGDYVDKLAERLKKGKIKVRPFSFQGRTLDDPREIGVWAAGEILEEFIKPACEKMGIKFDSWFSEKSLHDEGKVDKVIELFKKKNMAYKKDGALWYRSMKFGDDKDRVLVKSDGEKTYFAVDTAYHQNKFERRFDKVINIWGADHHGDVSRVKSAVEEVLEHKNKLDFIITQFVRVIKDGKEVRMSKRKGVYFALDDLIEEVGRDAVRFIFLSYTPSTHINFDINLAKKRSEKNPVYYVQYAHARISSILRKSGLGGSTSKRRLNLELLLHEKELSLMRELNKFPELIFEISQTYEVHKLPHYAIKLADKFHSFYDACRVIDEANPELTKARLNLVNAVRIVLAEILKLIGVSSPDRM